MQGTPRASRKSGPTTRERRHSFWDQMHRQPSRSSSPRKPIPVLMSGSFGPTGLPDDVCVSYVPDTFTLRIGEKARLKMHLTALDNRTMPAEAIVVWMEGVGWEVGRGFFLGLDHGEALPGMPGDWTPRPADNPGEDTPLHRDSPRRRPERLPPPGRPRVSRHRSRMRRADPVHLCSVQDGVLAGGTGGHETERHLRRDELPDPHDV